MTGTATARRPLRTVVGALLPEGRRLPDEVWRSRHRAVLVLAAAQALVLLPLGLLLGHPLPHVLPLVVLVLAPLAAALPRRWGRAASSAAATTSLFAASAVLVDLTGGLIESHFHFFVMVGVAALYQDWVPFGVGLGIVVLHHGVLGTFLPHSVYDHHDGMSNPWGWTALHAGFILAASCAHLASWRLNEQQSLHDTLTGVANRTQLGEVLERSLADGRGTAVVLLDLDGFKAVNDLRGSAVGDEVLRAVAQRLRGGARAGDRVGRLDGDEFAVVLDGAGGENATRAAARFLALVREPLAVDGQELTVQASGGVADSATLDAAQGAAGGGEQLLRNAELAVQQAKAAGGDRAVTYAEAMGQAATDRALLLEDLAGVVERGELEVHYQATVELDGGATEGFEALLRWRHPRRGLVPPLEFVPLAESSGHIVAIGTWVLRTAVLQAARWSREQGRPVTIGVNLSAVQLAGDEVVDVVAGALRDSGLPARQLTLEITESLLVGDFIGTAARLERLRELGARIAIDDFGTGYSSLSYLRRLPVDIVKIDRSFVGDLSGGGSATTLVASIVELARSLGLDVIAEGVETEQQAGALRALNCGLAQGYLYARPVSAGQVRLPATANPATANPATVR
ncbi:bifunctional diguanylate cyclase/phosphodiesterase [Kineococcus sp. TRM81007]|uniref:putative bifunctional diguanylate cyclase/phosphodiesterase n=1 Tax=Kineococcus sp. TRM81007 TaxID=2925831 RepID=UPI001F571779|nr:bifunctional diguanylate cyclase/phosphodiesterase [Kineococcus sp. TRM81007]MCI2240512.1 bifunctional diguanylate cyclase/phosphodiesterase [Kineococcus sp. TRM81007]